MLISISAAVLCGYIALRVRRAVRMRALDEKSVKRNVRFASDNFSEFMGYLSPKDTLQGESILDDYMGDLAKARWFRVLYNSANVEFVFNKGPLTSLRVKLASLMMFVFMYPEYLIRRYAYKYHKLGTVAYLGLGLSTIIFAIKALHELKPLELILTKDVALGVSFVKGATVSLGAIFFAHPIVIFAVLGAIFLGAVVYASYEIFRPNNRDDILEQIGRIKRRSRDLQPTDVLDAPSVGALHGYGGINVLFTKKSKIEEVESASDFMAESF
ncbi:MAG: hypothetical protein JXR42_05710 [Gammaproteobacteria bacterium]|nr:hypothetical protein [Gammaproteobacteria bacterium]